MVNHFPTFSRIVADNFQRIAKSSSVFVAGVSGDELYEAYLASFPEGTNPLFVQRTEHDCSCCKQFIRRVGNAIAVNGEGKILTVWDEAAKSAPHPYNVVAKALRERVVASSIVDLFRVSTKEVSFGAQVSHSQDKATGKINTWNHFYTGEIPLALRVASPGEVCGSFRTTVEVFERGLTELTPAAVETVRELITTNALYRGEEHLPALKKFQAAQRDYLKITDAADRRVYAWAHAGDSAARFRNTVIGTLVQDLSGGMDMEAAVRSFEVKVAPTNYKRTTALITPGMVKKAMETIAELGLEAALNRRFARLPDLSVTDVRWVNGASKPLMKGGIGDVLMAVARQTSTAVVDESRVQDITLEDFMTRVLPEATEMEVLFKNEHVGNLMVLTAPVDPEPRQLFRWTNDFAWSYGGNVADSIKERVKKAGGKVEGATLRVSLSWTNYDDLDLHVFEPRGRGISTIHEHIHFRNKRGWTGGVLDVDMNAGRGTTREPVENVVWGAKVPDGAYKVVVNNYTQRETSDPGFVVEVESGGKLTHFTYNKAVRNGMDVVVGTLHMKDGAIDRIEAGDSAISSAAVKQTKWGLTTETFVKVDAVTLSPNYWGTNSVGNRHTFFVLAGCQCDEAMRGIYNEFLHSRLEEHRKVFEVIGDRTKCQPTEGGLAGLGFSSTKKDSFVLRVRNQNGQRTYNVKVGQ
jgi:hypothetical protein